MFSWKREWERKLKEIKIETYAEWTAGVEANFKSYAHQAIGQSSYDTPICEKRLQIIERDPVALKLILDINRSIPNPLSEDFEELRMLVHTDPEWEWPPFRDKMNELLDHLRRQLL